MSTITRTDTELLHALRNRITATRIIDRARIARDLDRLFSRRERNADFDAAVTALSDAIDVSCGKVERLRGLPLNLTYDPDLPITQHREEILAAISKHPVIVLCGATGSGKTTQLPKLCLEAGRGALGLIGHTQPRRIAARAIAARLATELATSVGGAVGYQVRFNDRSGPDCRVKLMTDGILLKELESDRNLNRYDTLIIDEAHERSLNIDLLLGVLQQVLKKRADLKLIVTSATIDPDKFAAFFGGAPIIEVSGRSYPVEVRYRPLVADDEDAAELSLPEGVIAAVAELDRGGRADTLVFLPGEKQIRDCSEALSRAKFSNTDVLPLFSRLSTREQEKIFEGHSQRRIVLATNVAETSLTVPGIRNVIDSGLARISRYSVRGKVQRLPIEKIAKASADQRKGRCGREADGICIRLFSEDDFNGRDDFTPPEVLRTNLASVILRLAVLGLGEPAEFPFIDPPDTRLINDGYRLLQELKAVDDERRVTALGKQIASLPVDPRLARMLIAASHHACLTEMLVIAAFLEMQDPRERPADAQTQADQAHAVFADPRSDFVAVLNLWKAYQEQSEALSGSQLRKWCRERFLSFMRMREWQELHRQLKDAVEDIELRPNQVDADYSNLHQAILTGFLGNIGVLDEKREYLGARGSKFIVAPGTPLAAKPPKWIVAASIMETTRVFARMVAAVETQWIERAGEHLLKRSYTQPEWLEHKGFVSALESASLYGLVLVGERRVSYGAVAPAEARQIFIREALVEGRSSLRAEFLKHNRALREQVEALEAKVRRRDILVDDQMLCEFYLGRLPPDIFSVAALEKWLRSPQSKMPIEGLRMTLTDVVRRDPTDISPRQFPDTLSVAGNALPLTYAFDPGQSNDGATLTVPQPLLGTLDVSQLSWAVPGWHLEKITAVLRALPKEQRKHFVPVPDAAVRCLEAVGDAPSTESLTTWVARECGQSISPEDIEGLAIPDHLRLNVRVVQLDGRLVAEGRDLVSLRRASRSASSVATPLSSPAYRTWDFGELPASRTVERGGVKFTVYPAIRPRDGEIVIEECGSAEEAALTSRRGIVQLAMLALPQQAKLARKQFADRRELILLAQSMGPQQTLADAFVEKVFRLCFLSNEKVLPRTPVEFQGMLDAHRARLGELIERVAAQVVDILSIARSARQSLANVSGPQFSHLKDSANDIDRQIAALLPANFIAGTPDNWFEHLGRYLRALQRRIEKLPGNARRDAELMKAVAPFADAVQKQSSQAAGRTEFERMRWMIEEYRVSLYAQDLKTAIPVSEKRMLEQLEKVRQEALR